jgi:hypothetical protein
MEALYYPRLPYGAVLVTWTVTELTAPAFCPRSVYIYAFHMILTINSDYFPT